MQSDELVRSSSSTDVCMVSYHHVDAERVSTINLQSYATDFPTISNHLDDIELDKPTYDVSTTSKMDISMTEPSSAHVSMNNPVKTISNSPTSLARMCKGIMHLCF